MAAPPSTVAGQLRRFSERGGAKLLGFIGVGNMGEKMAANLLRGGFRLSVCDPKARTAVEGLQRMGATPVATPAELAALPGMWALVSMLPSSQHVREAYLGPHGVLSVDQQTLQPSLLIDSSTIDPITAQEVAREAQGRMLHPHAADAHGRMYPWMIDAPVSGGVPAAAAATLTFMAGGPPEAVAEAEPILLKMGRRVVRCGPSGSGVAAKVCNNVALAVSMAGVSEALALGRRLGIDPALLTRVFNDSSARCWSSEIYNPCPGVMEGVPSSRGYTQGFASRLMVKDMELAKRAAEAVGSPVPMAELARQLYEQVDPSLDFSAIFEAVYTSGK